MEVEQIGTSQTRNRLEGILSVAASAVQPDRRNVSGSEDNLLPPPSATNRAQVNEGLADTNNQEKESSLNSDSELLREQRNQEIQDAIQIANDFATVDGRRLEFSLSEDSGKRLVRVFNSESEELIRQIPSEEFVKISEKIKALNQEYNSVRGLLFDTTV